MVTGASTADVAVLLIDARKGVVEQTRRHAFIASLLGIRHLVVCVNKMDLVGYAQLRFEQVEQEFREFCARLETTDVTFIPTSAVHGENIVERSEHMPWYQGPALLYHLEHVHISSDRNLIDCRFPVQWVVRPGPGVGRATPTIAATPARSPPACSAPAIRWWCCPVARRPGSPRSTPRTGRSSEACAPMSVDDPRSTAISTSRAGT